MKTLSRLRFALLSTLMLLTAAIWGFSFVVVKDSLKLIGPVWMLSYRFSIAAVFMAAIYFKKLHSLTRTTILQGCLLGVFLFTAYLLQTIGCKHTTAGKNAFFTTIYVFLVPLFSALMMKTKLRIKTLFCALLSLGGIALLSLGGDAANQEAAFNFGDVLTLLCSVFFALHIAYGAKSTQASDPLTLSVLQFLVAAILGTFTAPLFDGPPSASQLLDKKVVISMIYLGVFSTMVGFALQNVGLKYLPSNFASLLLSTESLFGAIFGVVLLHEAMTVCTVAGGLLMTASLVLSQVSVPFFCKKCFGFCKQSSD